MAAYETLLVIFIIVATGCIVGCVISTMLVYFDYYKMKRNMKEEIEHLKKERDVCRQLLIQKGENIHDGS